MSLHIPVDIGAANAADRQNGMIVQAAVSKVPYMDIRGDADRTTGALRRAVDAEFQFRSIVDEAQPGKVQDAAQRFGKVPHSALAGTSDPVEQAALIGQLDQGMAFHEDRLALRAMQDKAQEMTQLRDERLKGMLRDASDAGGMAGSASSPELQQRAFMHFSNSMLSLEQTFRAAGKILGEDHKAVGEGIRVSRSGMTGAFLTRMAQNNPSHAKALLSQMDGVLEEEDRKKAGESIAQSVQDRAIATLEADYHDGKSVKYDTALKALSSRSGDLGLEAKDRTVVRERLEIAKARQEYLKGKADEEERNETFSNFYKSVDEGDMVAAHRLLDGDTVLSESQRGRMRASLKHEKWETEPKPFLTIFKKMESGKLDSEFEIIPARDLSSKDAMLLRDVVKVKDPRAVMENRLMFTNARRILDGMDGEKDERKAEAMRTLVGVLAQARKNGDDPAVLFTPGKEGNIIDHMFRVYGGEKGNMNGDEEQRRKEKQGREEKQRNVEQGLFPPAGDNMDFDSIPAWRGKGTSKGL